MGKIVLLMLAAAVIFIGMQNLNGILTAVSGFFSLFTPFIAGLCIAFILNIPMRFFEEKVFGKFGAKNPDSRASRVRKKLRRPLSLVLTFILVAVLITLIMLVIVPEIANTVKLLATVLPGYAEQLADRLDAFLIDVGLTKTSLFEMEINWNILSDKLIDFFTNGATTTIVNKTYAVTAKLLGGLFNLILSLVFSIYVLAAKERLGRWMTAVLEALLPDPASAFILRVGRLANGVFAAFVAGQLTEAVILGLLCFTGMSILRFPYAAMISVLIGVTALIPVFGAFIGAAVGAFLILMTDPMQALWFLIFILILQQVENNLIYPRVVGKSVGLSGMLVLLAITVGSSTGGALGMLIAVPVCSVAYTLFSELIRTMLAKRGRAVPSEFAEEGKEAPPPKPLRDVASETISQVKKNLGKRKSRRKKKK